MGRRMSRLNFHEAVKALDQEHKFDKKGHYFPLHYEGGRIKE